MSGHYGDLSPKQEEALAKFRDAVADIPDKPQNDDYYHLRWLRARKFNVKKAEAMLRNHIEVRRQYGANTIIQDWTPPEVLQKCFPGGFFGEDRDGHPVWYDSVGNLDFRGLHMSCKKEDILKLKCLHQELGDLKLKEFSEKKGRRIETITIVLDFENLSLQRHYYWPGIEMVKEVLALGESGDPESIKITLIVRAPSIFPMCYNVVKHLLDENTRKKVHVLGSNWKEELQKYISPDQLPQEFGGTRCEPDPWCTDHINPGRDVPQECYLTNLTEIAREEMDRVVVTRRGAHKVTLQVHEANSIIKWEFVSSSYDIAFGMYIKTVGKGGKTKKEVFPLSRKESHITPESGTYVCKETGTYVLKFDNSYSWTRSKEVYYSFKILPPGTELHVQAPPISSLNPSCSDGDDEFFECNEGRETLVTFHQSKVTTVTGNLETGATSAVTTVASDIVTNSEPRVSEVLSSECQTSDGTSQLAGTAESTN